MDGTARSHASLPSELLHKILTGILAVSIHAMCVSPDACRWDMDVVWILATTCFTWKEIVRGILVVAFTGVVDSAKKGHKSDLEFFGLIHLKLTQLRAFGMRSREQFSTTSSLSSRPILSKHSPPLEHAYFLYLTSTALRHHVVELGKLDAEAHSTVVSGLQLALKVCEKITPRGLVRPLVWALEKQILVVDFGTAIAKARKDLEDCLSKLPLSSSPHHQHETKTGMHNALHLAENTTCPSCNNVDINATDLRQLLEVSGIIDTLQKYRGIHLDIDEYDLERRVVTLIERWSTDTHEH